MFTEVEAVASYHDFVRRHGQPIPVSVQPMRRTGVPPGRTRQICPDGSFIIDNGYAPVFCHAETAPIRIVLHSRLEYAQARLTRIREDFDRAKEHGQLEEARRLRAEYLDWRRQSKNLKNQYEALPEVQELKRQEQSELDRQRTLDEYRLAQELSRQAQYAAAQELNLEETEQETTCVA